MSRFPRAELVLEAIAGAAALRRAADELDQLATEAATYEPATIRRRLRAVGLELAFVQPEGEQP